MILSTIVYYKLNLRIGLIIGSIILALGASLKWFINHSLEIFFIGQTIWGVSQPLFVVAPALFATQWFEDSKRRLAITIGGTAIAGGIIIGLLLPTVFLDDTVIGLESTRTQVQTSLIVQAGIAGVLMILTIFTFQNKPKHFPSQKATIKRKEYLLESIKALLVNGEFLKLWVCFGMFYSNLIVLTQICDEVVGPFGYNSDSVALFGTLNVAGGIAGSFLFGYYLK